MIFFNQPKPRRFKHEPIYYDEHRDRVRQIEERAAKELNAKENGKISEDEIRNAFSKNIRERKERRDRFFHGSLMANAAALIIIILVLVIVWLYLAS